jgi:hypothetical protein
LAITAVYTKRLTCVEGKGALRNRHILTRKKNPLWLWVKRKI